MLISLHWIEASSKTQRHMTDRCFLATSCRASLPNRFELTDVIRGQRSALAGTTSYTQLPSGGRRQVSSATWRTVFICGQCVTEEHVLSEGTRTEGGRKERGQRECGQKEQGQRERGHYLVFTLVHTSLLLCPYSLC